MARYFLGDVLAIVLFALLARIAHQSDTMPFSAAGVADTAWPFLIGTLVAWGIIYLAALEPWRIAPAGISVWLCSVIAGLGIWGLRHGEMPHWSFILVASLVSLLLLLGWRGVALKFQKNDTTI
ncbi:hypothetical protein CCICO_00950 [Corynebacterium ciconiae DSM 44920]|uniref:DUF3054 domain-containing protein n=1 Tax=Corynebacterium ciconiae TaxID=227319 RepID=UPI0003772752|nr:DUF3054 domain-containing protein [Corynebacterium ciconiae]WKD60248.1 hypothetical protein CCICO_00950 [Corynebacterium ciconiae DSM 44920]